MDVERVKKQLTENIGLKQYLFTKPEITYCESKKMSFQHFAARYAAKEAFLKAVGIGWRNGITFNEIEILNDDLGKPEIKLSGKAKEIIDNINFKNIFVSISHLKNLVNAIVIIDK